ncbi:hypothetical protein [Streptomyces sp. BPTC-684]|uniref:hypothetical protein n=1 Tax=Streptomyces sp. BPTC-684 TaxID=3043734 RepID=UPI0024B07A48|nr:hypothetical protein [Streptomyces sp. BPTC-684]WHM40950.1 hypothetical protein QIY60_31465 [Streptomyces sp. BPTC-684]
MTDTYSTRSLFVSSGYWMATGGPEDFERFTDEAFSAPEWNGVIRPSAEGGMVAVATQTQWDELHLSVYLYEAPPSLDTDGWDTVVDISILAHPSPEPGDDGHPVAYLAFLDDGSPAEEAPDPIVLPAPGGAPAWWRLRFQARTLDGMPEEHCFQLWPAERQSEAQHKVPKT